MQTYPLLSFEFQAAQQRLRETFTESKVPAKARNLQTAPNYYPEGACLACGASCWLEPSRVSLGTN